MWRILLVCGAALLGYGCSRKNEEHDAAPANSAPRPSVAPAPTPYTFPTGFSLPRPVTPAVLPRLDCSRFRMPSMGVRNINRVQDDQGVHSTDGLQVNAATEFPILRNVITKGTRHLSAMQRNDFTGVQADAELTTALLGLRGRDIYLFNGDPYTLDTMDDWVNLNAAFSLLGVLEAKRDESDNARMIHSAWVRNALRVEFSGYNFNRDELPPSLPIDADSRQSHFRVITPSSAQGNYLLYPILRSCSVDSNKDTSQLYIPN